ncbi:MAG: DNA-formamidopyrimidine glycosylase [bacterium]
MPELPEVQTVVNDLQIILGDTIISFWSDFEKAIKSKDFEKNILGKKIIDIKRISKNIVLELENNSHLMIHLKMTGKILTNKNFKPARTSEKHLHHVFYLKKNGVLEFHDIRKFATLELLTNEKLLEIVASKGMDPFSADFDLANFEKIVASRKNKNVKSLLMDQKAISGIGNIYASEIPFSAKINPLRKNSTLTKKEIAALYNSTIKILTKAILLRGTSISDYRDANGKRGSFQNELMVYGKVGDKCKKCDTIIQKAIVEQRSTFYCPTCQH